MITGASSLEDYVRAMRSKNLDQSARRALFQLVSNNLMPDDEYGRLISMLDLSDGPPPAMVPPDLRLAQGPH